MLKEGECSIHRFSLGSLSCLAQVLPLVALRQVGYPTLKAVMEKEPVVLVEARPAAHPAAGRQGLHTYLPVLHGRRGCPPGCLQQVGRRGRGVPRIAARCARPARATQTGR
jgi:hypothetical protein